MQQHYEVLGRFSLPTTLPEGVNTSSTIAYLHRDKKARGSITFVLQNGQGNLEVVPGISLSEIEAAFASMRSWS